MGEVRAVLRACKSHLKTFRGYNVNFKLAAGLLAGGLLMAAPAFSATIDFEGVANGFGSIADYYNGGQDIPVSGPASSGPNLGVHFGLDLGAFSDPDHFNFANDPAPGTSAMAVAGSGGDYAMTTSFGMRQLSFLYSATADTSVTVSFNTGPSQTYALAANSSGCDIVNGPAFCVWGVTSLDLGDRFATGVDFGATSGLAAFDNVSVSAVPLPAAAWLLMSALGGLGVIRRKRAA